MIGSWVLSVGVLGSRTFYWAARESSVFLTEIQPIVYGSANVIAEGSSTWGAELAKSDDSMVPLFKYL